jgi:hypothetical protein
MRIQAQAQRLWPPWVAACWLIAGLVLLAGIGGCRQGVPVIDPTAGPPVDGTISGILRGPEGTSRIEGRLVEAINVTTGERSGVTTGVTGGFTLKVKPGKYRLSVQLQPGETVLKDPGVIDLNSSDLDARRDIVIGTSRIQHQQFRPSAVTYGLGAPIA